MFALLRHPMTWLVAGEAAVVGALVAVAWYVLTLPGGPPPVTTPVPPAPPPRAARSSPSPMPTKTPRETASPRPSPVARASPTPLKVPDLVQLNRDTATFEQLDAGVIRDLEGALLAYLDRVVVPAVMRAEREKAATSAAATQSAAATRKTP